MTRRAGVASGVLVVLLGVAPAAGQDAEWLVVWNGVDRPGPVNLPFTTGWPADEPGFEQYDPNGCYDAPGPDYAEAANVDTAGWLAIQNLLDGSCIGIGHVDDGGECNAGTYRQTRTNPCGMRYQAGPQTVLNYWGPEFAEIMAYHGEDNVETLTNGVTAELSFYIAARPTQWTKLIELEAYPRYDNPWNTGGGSYDANHYCRVQVRHFVDGEDPNDWFLVASADNTFNLGLVEDHNGTPGSLMGRWVTVRLALSEVPGKPQMTVWIDGIIHHEGGWDALNDGDSNGSTPHGYCRFGWNHGEGGDIRIGHMAFTNEGTFSPNPRGQCRDYFGQKYLRYLPSAARTKANPEICDNGADDDGDGFMDCEDPDCFQDEVCGNILVNGSFEKAISPCEEVDCASGLFDSRPEGWGSTSGSAGIVTTHGDQWVPTPSATDSYTRGSVSSTGGSSIVYQSVLVVSGTPVALKGDIATGHSDGTAYEHFVELVDGDESSEIVIDSFVETDRATAFQPFSLAGTCETGEVTVRWGYRNLAGGGAVSTHVDNLYLTGSPRGKCNDPFADADADGDVDGDDFGAWQACYTGTGGGPVTGTCECFDVDGAGGLPDGDVDQGDLAAFEACASGPAIAAEASCDDGVVQPPFNIVSAGSRKMHGAAGNWDVDMLAPGATEPRNNGPELIMVEFDEFVEAADGSLDIGDEVSASVGTITGATLACDTLTIEMQDVPDESCLVITLSGLAPSSEPTNVGPDRQIRVAVLFGDASQDGVVDSTDVSLVSGSTGQTVDGSTFRRDLDFDGDIDNIDVVLAQVNDGHSASCP